MTAKTATREENVTVLAAAINASINEMIEFGEDTHEHMAKILPEDPVACSGEEVTKEEKYYLCTFVIDGEKQGKYQVEIMNIDPVDFMLSHKGYVLLTHIEMTKEQYDMYLSIG